VSQPVDHRAETAARGADIGFDPLRIAINGVHEPRGLIARFGAGAHERFATDHRGSGSAENLSTRVLRKVAKAPY
jgi:hypothetical protein